MTVRKGDTAFVKNHMNGGFLKPHEVMVLTTDSPGRHSVKVQVAATGAILYCSPDQIMVRQPSPAAAPKAKETPKEKVEEKKVTITTEAEAARKKEMKESNKPSYEDVKKLFMALSTAEHLTSEYESLRPIVDLAEAQIREQYAGGWQA